MDNQHQLIQGYRDLNEKEIAAINAIKQKANEIDVLLSNMQLEISLDRRWKDIGKNNLQQGFSAIIRSIAKRELRLLNIAIKSPEKKTRTAMTEKELIAWIDNAGYEELLRKWRFEPAASAWFAGAVGIHFQNVFHAKKNELNHKQAAEISKRVGWGK